jgi:excisionase family DNA binding protein
MPMSQEDTANTLTQLVYEAKEIEPILRLGKNAVNALLRSGKLRSVRYGKKYLIPASAITDFLSGDKN